MYHTLQCKPQSCVICLPNVGYSYHNFIMKFIKLRYFSIIKLLNQLPEFVSVGEEILKSWRIGSIIFSLVNLSAITSS